MVVRQPIGIALSDPTATIAQPLETIAAAPVASLPERLAALAHLHQAGELVVGLPKQMDGGLGPEDAVAYARELKRIGLDYVCVSSGAMVPHARIPVAPGYQVGFAQKIKQAVPIAVRAVGMIADPDQAEEIVASGKADMVALARGFLDDPRWVWHAAERFGIRIDYPPQYARSRPDLWPGAQIARPRETV